MIEPPRERRMVQPGPVSGAYRISLSKELADDLLKDGVLASADLDALVNDAFPQAAAGSTT